MSDLGYLPRDRQEARQSVHSWLSSGGRPDSSSEGVDLVSVALARGDAVMLSELLAAGAQVPPSAGLLALEAAILTGRPYLLKRQISLGTDAQARDAGGGGLPHLAARNADMAAFVWSLRCGWDKDAPDNLGKTPLFHILAVMWGLPAEINRRLKFLRDLLDMGVDTKVKDWSGATPLESFLRLPTVQTNWFPPARAKIVAWLQESGLRTGRGEGRGGAKGL